MASDYDFAAGFPGVASFQLRNAGKPKIMNKNRYLRLISCGSAMLAQWRRVSRAAVIAAATFIALLLASAAGFAQTWPAKPLRLILPVGAGSASDTIARLVARGLSDRLGQQIVIDNQPGAGGNIGMPLADRKSTRLNSSH